MNLSIITVSLNNLEGLRNTLDSIQKQNFINNNSIEWIVIDGGSTDESLQFLSNLNLNFHFRYISERDSGIFNAMNKGINLSMGKFIFFLNSGDTLASSDVLNLVLDKISKTNKSIVSGLVEIKYKSYYKITDLKPWVCHQSVFVTKKLLVNYMFDEKLKIYGDLDLWKKMKKVGAFDVERIDIIVSKFTLGGVGNSPEFIFQRLRERKMISDRYNDRIPYIIRIFHALYLYFLFKLLGMNAYYRLILK